IWVEEHPPTHTVHGQVFVGWRTTATNTHLHDEFVAEIVRRNQMLYSIEAQHRSVFLPKTRPVMPIALPDLVLAEPKSRFCHNQRNSEVLEPLGRPHNTERAVVEPVSHVGMERPRL